ncbi:MAG: protein phosphatase [Selenomonadaceae bacterium]|nr:protein phosphatase [Selenomonadaceae bacterium]
MRKSNSIFKTAFVSESGAELSNNDYFAYVEFDDYACYVIASSITDFGFSDAAKEAVEHLILSFQENPSMNKSSLKRYLHETNERFLSFEHSQRLKASVLMLVTDYEKFRYIAAGNIRLRMYRQGRFFLKSDDMSLANDLVERGETETPLDKHEERHNLYAYLGKKNSFSPFVSRIIKLDDADIVSLYTQGLWENVDEQEIDEIFSEASDDPQESIDTLEDVLLSRQPPNLKSYTIAAIFVNKIFRDPERERKRQRYIKIAIISLIIILIIAIIGYIFYSWRQNKIETLEKTVQTTLQYIDAENFLRAQESCKEALTLAQDLKRTDEETTLREYMLVLDDLVNADALFNAQNYRAAYDAYIHALKYVPTINKTVHGFIRQRLEDVGRHLDAEEFMQLGDSAFNNNDFDTAEGMYLKARDKASDAHNIATQSNAVAALEKLYDKKASLRKDAEQQLADKKKVALSDALKKGDDLLAAGDLEGAQAAYLDARNLTDDPADRTITSAALEKVTEAKDKKDLEEKTAADDLKKRFEDAQELEKKADEFFNAKDYLTAQIHYSQAIDDFESLHEDDHAQIVKNKYDTAKLKFFETRGQKMEAEDNEEYAREHFVDKNYPEAQAAAERAKKLYTDLGMKDKADEMDILIQQITTDAAIDNALK